MRQDIQKIGLFDSGLGGLTVLRELVRVAPHLDYFYLGDTARTPYGAKSATTITRYAIECTHFLLDFDIDLLIVACNTASSYALTRLREVTPVPVIGTIDPAVREALGATRSHVVGVLGTEATVASGVYERALREHSSKMTVRSIACPLFVPLVEQGMISGPIVDLTIEHYLSPLRHSEVDTVVLGCTHYPAIRERIAHYLGAGVKLVECSHAIGAEVQSLLPTGSTGTGPTQPGRGERRFFVTDEVRRFDRLSALLMGDVDGVDVGEAAQGQSVRGGGDGGVITRSVQAVALPELPTTLHGLT